MLQQAFARMVESAQQRLIVLVGAHDWAEARRAADAYRAVLKARDDLMQLTRRNGRSPSEDWRNSSGIVHFYYGADEAALRDKAKNTGSMGIGQALQPVRRVKIAWQDDPFGRFGGWVQARAQETPVSPRDGQLFVGDGHREYVVLPITLRVPAFSSATQQATMALLEQARRAAQKIEPESRSAGCRGGGPCRPPPAQQLKFGNCPLSALALFLASYF